MLKNVELKARVRNVDDLLARAKQLTNGDEGTLLIQHDTFFNATNGRLKLRKFGAEDEKKPAELIFYNRNNETGPKLSEYIKVDLVQPEHITALKLGLANAIGVRGEVHKERRLYLLKPYIRIHIDKVSGLGNFMEIEVCINDTLSVESGEIIAKEIIAKLGLTEKDLISGAYIDEIQK